MTHPLAQASFAGCDAPHPALRAFAARQDTNAAFAAHECACFAGYTNGEWGMENVKCKVGNGEEGLWREATVATPLWAIVAYAVPSCPSRPSR